jgi:arylsulfatase A-like enzyme
MHLHEPLPADQWSIARYLKGAGYTTLAAGKWHLGDAERANWNATAECKPAEVGDKAVEVLRGRARDKPFFMWVAAYDPHRNYPDGTNGALYSLEDAQVPEWIPDTPKVRADYLDYYSEISRFDKHVGQVMAELERQGVLDRTVVIYLSDNGAPFPREKTTLYDGGIKTPLMMRYPPLIEGGRVEKALVSSIDLMPTILEMAGVGQTSAQGVSLLGLLQGETDKVHEMIFAEANLHDFYHFSRAVRTLDYLLVRHYEWRKPAWAPADAIRSPTWQEMLRLREAGRLTRAQQLVFEEPRPYEEFFDINQDPYQLSNMADREDARAAFNDLRAQLDEWRVLTNDRVPDPPPSDTKRRDGSRVPKNRRREQSDD